MDITSADTTSEFFLIKQWGQVNLEEITAFNQALITAPDPCPVDTTNNRMAIACLRSSICPELKRMLDQELPIDSSAALMFWKIIHKAQCTNSAAGRTLLKTIEAQRLSEESGFDVDKFCSKLHPMCTTLTGLGTSHVPFDFAILIISCFDTTGIQQFDLEIATMANQLDNDMSAYTW